MLQAKDDGHNVGSEEPEEKKRVQEAGIDASPAMSSEAVPCEATQHATTQPSPEATTSEAAPLETTKPSPGATQGKAKEHSAMQLSATLLAKVWVSGLLAGTTPRTMQEVCKSFGVGAKPWGNRKRPI